MKVMFRCEPFNLNPRVTRSIIFGTLSTFAVLMGIVPQISLPLRAQFSGGVAQAQTQQPFTTDEIQSYARAVLGMEPRRQAAYDEISSIVGSNVPLVVCHQTRSINRLKQDVRAIAVNYCSQAKVIIESNALTISRFNEITLSQESNPQLKEQIQAELRRLQQNTISGN